MLNKIKYPSHKKKQLQIAIIGGGVGGCMAGLELAKQFPDVKIIIFDKNNKLLQGTSNCTPGRMGLGFHYVHEKSAIT
ncbi:MAG: NAD(P)-binding protein, partial [Rickettsiella sp.]|nr:NAD(P)-binding protein [Rickettsiella sp.]